MSDIDLLRVLPISVGGLWRAFSEAERFNAWLWPPRVSPLTVIDFRQGGAWRVTSSELGWALGGLYGEIEDEDELEFSWQWDGEDDVSMVKVRFDELGERETTLRIEHSGFDDQYRQAQHEQAWFEALDRLPAACGR